MVTLLASYLLFGTLQIDKTASLLSQSHTLRTIDPRDEEFSDLEPIQRAIGASRVVLLGEQSHGDGATIAAKIRLVKFLHERMGFDVLAWESGLYSCTLADRNAKDAGKPSSAYSQGIFRIWTDGGLFPLISEYVKATQSTPRPIQTCGFDCQFSSKESASLFISDLKVALAGKGCDADIATIEDFLITKRGSVNDAELSTLIAAVKRLSDRLKPRLVGDTTDILRQTTLQLPAFAKGIHLLELLQANATDPKSGKKVPADIGNARDKSMADVLIWTVNSRFKGNKVIVWAASSHIARNLGKVESFPDSNQLEGDLVMMGDPFFAKLKQQAYSIAFTAFDGQVGNPMMPKPFELVKPDAGSLEEMYGSTGQKFEFLDFRSLPKTSWLRGPVDLRPLGYGPLTANWATIFDGLIYTRRMFPHTKEFLLPEDAIR